MAVVGGRRRGDCLSQHCRIVGEKVDKPEARGGRRHRKRGAGRHNCRLPPLPSNNDFVARFNDLLRRWCGYCTVYWVLLRLLLRGSTDARPTDHFRLGGALLLCGIVAGALTGLLSSSPFLGLLYCTPLGLLGGLLLGGPYFLVALLERRKEGRASTGTATEKVPARHSSDAKESPN